MPKATTTKKKPAKSAKAATATADWRDDMIERIRTLITQADPELIEETKWRKPSNSMAGVPVWSHPTSGMVCTGERYKGVVKLTFAKGAAVDDPSGLFNAGFGGGTRRAIDIGEGDKLNATAFKALVRAAVALNTAAGTKRKTTKRARPE